MHKNRSSSIATTTSRLEISPDPIVVRITEVGPRDGLQNQPALIPTNDKVAFIEALAIAGFAEIEVSSFVSPKWVPQLADAAEVFATLHTQDNVMYSALVPNMRGMERAIESGVKKISVFTAATDAFAKRNTNATIDESIKRITQVVRRAKDEHIAVRGYISCVIRCPYSGWVDPADVAVVTQKLLDIGIDEIDLGDTLGVAVPTDIETLYDGISHIIQPQETALHTHDTRGTALACILTAINLGVRAFDTSSGGLGGCPYAPGAAGNAATEDVIFCLERMGIQTGIHLDRLIAAGRLIEKSIGRPLPSRAFRALNSHCTQ